MRNSACLPECGREVSQSWAADHLGVLPTLLPDHSDEILAARRAIQGFGSASNCDVDRGRLFFALGSVPVSTRRRAVYVPPGHGIVYLFGLRWARTPIALKHPAALAWFAIVGASAWAVAGLTLSPMLAHRPDVWALSACRCWPGSLGPSGSVYAGVFLVTSLLELVGTGLGTGRGRQRLQ